MRQGIPKLERVRVQRLYAMLTDRELEHLRRAFVLDRQAATASSTIAFCNGRIACIDAELARRGTS